MQQNFIPLLDAIVKANDSDGVTRSINKLRKILNGTMPSAFFRNLTSEPSVDFDQERAELQAKLDAEEVRNAVLTERLAACNKLMADSALRGGYPLNVFLDRLYQRRQQVYGWRTDYCRATQITPNATLATTSHIQHWQKKYLVPGPFVDQIPWLIFPNRHTTREGGH